MEGKGEGSSSAQRKRRGKKGNANEPEAVPQAEGAQLQPHPSKHEPQTPQARGPPMEQPEQQGEQRENPQHKPKKKNKGAKGGEPQPQQQQPPPQQGAWEQQQQQQQPPPQQGAWEQQQQQQQPPPQQGEQRENPQHKQKKKNKGAKGGEPQPHTQQQQPPPQQGAWEQQQQQQQPPPQQGEQRENPQHKPKKKNKGAKGGEPQPQQQQPPPQQGAWGQQQQQQQPPPQQGAWGQQQQQQQPPPQQGAWGQQQQQQPPPQQGAWGQQQQQQQPPPQQGAWGQPRGPHPQQQQQQQQPPPQQGAWGQPRGPHPQQQQQQPPTQQRAEASQSSRPRGQGDSVKKAAERSAPQRETKSPPSVGSVQFSPRICAKKQSGKRIEVDTNFFRLLIKNPDMTVYHYDVVIEPDKPKYLIRKVWNAYMSLVFPSRLAAFDGKNAYSKGPLTDGNSVVTTVTVFNEENREKEFKVSINEVRRVSFACFKDYRTRIQKDQSLKVLPEAELTVLDIILMNYACDNFVKSGRSFFSSPVSKDLSDKLCMRFGYFQSAFLGYSPYLNFDISHKAFYKDFPVMNILNSFRSRHTRNIDVDEMNRFIRTVKVEYKLPNDKSSVRVFRVNKLVDDANTQKFKKEDGSTMTVAQYFSTEKKCKLKYPDLPLLWVGPTQKSIYLPMEFCTILPDQVYKGPVDPFETREMVRNATSNARVRQKDVYRIFDDTNINSHPLMAEFGLEVSNDMERVPARVLDAPRLKTSGSITVREGVWRIRNFLKPVTLKKWCILILDRQVRKQNVMDLQRFIKTKGTELNMQIADAAKTPMEGDPSFAGIKKAFSELKDMELVFVIISEAKGLYSRVKTICETQEGILTQCIKSRTVSQDPRKLTTTVENILLKVNAKLGGINHSLDTGCVPQCLHGYVMVVGADVTHASPGMNIPSVAAVTVSCDPAAFQYGTTTRVQPKGEMIRDMEEIMTVHVKKFHDLHGNYPQKIIFFRDGVSEGEMEKVLKGELSAVKRACNRYNCQPKITFVIVQKRHHTRLYPVRDEDAQGKNFNVPVGTCVDSEVVHPRELEFYLVSHASILGTARPTRYRLIHDDNKLTDDEVETLAFYLCHLFSRCNRSVSYPSPTYNAHLAAARVRAYLEGLNMGGLDVGDIQKKMPDRISRISQMFFV